MLKVVMSRRWHTALAVAAIFAVACVFLGRWQWHRHEDRAASAQRINNHYLASPVPLSVAMPSAGAALPRAEEWTVITTTGRYADQNRLLVRNRPNNAVFGYEVMVPLEVADGTSLLVDRGWIPNGRSAAEPSAVPATPTGDITVTGWLKVGEPSLGRQMPAGQLASINLAEAQAQTGDSLYGAYLILRSETGTPGQQIVRPAALGSPDTGEGPHLAYALQWWFAAPTGFVLIFFGARRELLEASEALRPAPVAAGGTTPPPHPRKPAKPAKPAKVKKTRIWDEEDA